MRKFKIAVVVAGGLLLSIGLLAQEKTKVQDRQTVQESTQTQMGDASAGHGMNYIDDNANGICDRFEQRQSGQPNMSRGMGHGYGQNFIDENGDGVCDNRSGGNMHGNRGSGNGNGQGHGSMGQGRNH